MNRLPFTKYASKALNEGREIAGYLGFKDVSSIFVLLGLYRIRTYLDGDDQRWR